MTEAKIAGWLLKTEPGSYGWSDLVADGKTVWDGVKNNLALSHIRRMKKGDRVLVYHTGSEKAIVGLAKVTKDAYPDPKAKDPKLAVVDLAPDRPLKKAVPLSEVKARKDLQAFPLVRLSRLSVMPVTPAEWTILMGMAGEKG